MGKLAIGVALTVALATGAALPALNAQASTLTTLYTFTGGPDGGSPTGPFVVLPRSHSLYGAVSTGGVSGYGSIFRLDLVTGAETTVYSFRSGNDGQAPTGITLYNGSFYGTTTNDAGSNSGSVFKFNLSTHTESVLWNFAFGGSSLQAGLIYAKGNLYGTTPEAPLGYGEVFSINPATNNFVGLYRFTGERDGAFPSAPLIYVGGYLYGTTNAGGASNYGTLFRINSATGVETVLYSFKQADTGAGVPQISGLTAANGSLYGTLPQGGAKSSGAVFKFTPITRTMTTLHSFQPGPAGAHPSGGLIFQNGFFYGTTLSGGPYGYGTIFKVDPTTGAETVLYNFTGGVDGGYPMGTLTYSSGAFYGTAGNAIFKFTP